MFLFLQVFGSGTWVPKVGEDDTCVLTLHSSADGLLLESTRPHLGQVPMQRLLDALGFTPDNPPNAALVAEHGEHGGEQEILIDQQVEGERDSRYVGGERLQKAGLYARARHPGRAPFTLALTRKDVPRNVFALAVHQIHSLRLGFQARVTPGTRQARVGFLFKRNSGAGSYRAEVLCKTGESDAATRTVAVLPIAEQPDTWQQVGANVELPEDARGITVFVHVERQAGDATCWFADAFIGEYAPDGP